MRGFPGTAMPAWDKRLTDEAFVLEASEGGLAEVNMGNLAAKMASDSGNFDQAVQILTEATQMDPNRDLLWLKLGDAQRSAAQKAADPDRWLAGVRRLLEDQ